jgi:hypothetical protein
MAHDTINQTVKLVALCDFCGNFLSISKAEDPTATNAARIHVEPCKICLEGARVDGYHEAEDELRKKGNKESDGDPETVNPSLQKNRKE